VNWDTAVTVFRSDGECRADVSREWTQVCYDGSYGNNGVVFRVYLFIGDTVDAFVARSVSCRAIAHGYYSLEQAMIVLLIDCPKYRYAARVD